MSEAGVDVQPPAPSTPAPAPVRRRRSKQRSRLRKLIRRHRVLTAVAGLLVAVLIALLVWLFYLNKQLGDIPTFDGEREGVPAGEVRNILLIGSDDPTGRGDLLDVLDAGEEWPVDVFRSDAIMVIHLDADRSGAQVVSIPRDSYVSVPGEGKTKLAAAFGVGGPELLTDTVEDITGLAIDHVAVMDFQGFIETSESIGGVDVVVAETVTDTSTGKVWEAGPQHLEGENALEYVRHRKGLPDNIFDRDQRQQNFLRAVFDKIVQPSVLANPVRLTNLLESFSSVMAVDDTLTPGVIRSLALQSRSLRPSIVRFVTAPYLGNPTVGGESVVKLDKPLVAEMFEAIEGDRFEAWYAENPVPTLPAEGSVP